MCIRDRDIIVLGRLAGNAYAGGDGRDHHFIAALEMTPQKLKIGDLKYKTKESSLWTGRLRKGQPKMECDRNGEIQMQSITAVHTVCTVWQKIVLHLMEHIS